MRSSCRRKDATDRDVPGRTSCSCGGIGRSWKRSSSSWSSTCNAKLDEERKQIADSARASEAEKARLREADLLKKLDDAQSHAAEMQRQLEQGSQQSQGEVLELLLEQQLAEAFPFDAITEVKKGVRGGDAVHTVTTRSGQVAGVVLWEAKRAQNWSRQWPPSSSPTCASAVR